MKYVVVPAIISTTQKQLDRMISAVKERVDRIHVDIMDGVFVSHKRNWFDMKLPKFKGKYEAHLMIDEPEHWIKKHGKKFDMIIVHYESCGELSHLIRMLRGIKRKVGIALRPETPVSKMKKYLKRVDQVMVLSVHPGRYGARFLPKTIKKVQALRRMNKSINIEVDGGITPMHVKKMKRAGANIFVSGSFVFKRSKNPEEALRKLNAVID